VASAVVVGGIAIQAGLSGADPEMEILAHDQEEFLRRCYEVRKRVENALTGAGIWAVCVYALVLFGLTSERLPFDEEEGLQVTNAWGIPYLAFLVVGLSRGGRSWGSSGRAGAAV
jgi:hypothetical protein